MQDLVWVPAPGRAGCVHGWLRLLWLRRTWRTAHLPRTNKTAPRVFARRAIAEAEDVIGTVRAVMRA